MRLRDDKAVNNRAAEILTLDGMSAAQLRTRYAEVFGEESRSGNRRWLVRRIAWRLQSQAEGGLTERARRRAEELARDEDLRVRPPRFCVQTRAEAPTSVAGRLERRDDRIPIPGTVLTRTYKGTDHRVMVLTDGFEHEGEVFKSLSAVAHAITGSHWNGFHFFGLAHPKDKGASG